jgi:hypothetical protein
VRLLQLQQRRSPIGVPYAQSGASSQFCNATTVQTFTGAMEFGLDDPVASKLLGAAMANSGNRQCVASWAASCPTGAPANAQFIGPMPPRPAAPAPADSLADPFFDATFGAGNITANLFGIYQGIDHSIARAVSDIRTQRAMDLIVSGAQKSAKVNANVTIFDANAPRRAQALKAGQPIPADSAAPRIRVRLTNIPTTVVDPSARSALKSAVTGANPGGSNFGQAAQNKIQNALISADWEKRTKFFGTRAGAGVLAFGPTLVLDLAATTTRDTTGTVRLDAQEFVARAAGSQSANVIGVLAGVAAVVFLPVTATAATIVIVGLGAGIVAQGVFGLFGADKVISNTVRDAQGRPRQ